MSSGINVTMRPAAGVLGVVAYPIQGAWKSTQGTWARKQVLQQRSTRVADGVDEVARSSEEERQRIVAKFKALTSPDVLKQRRKSLTDAAKAAMEQSPFQAFNDSATSSSTSTSLLRTSPGTSEVQDGSEVSQSVTLQGGNDSAEEIFQRDLELAKQLSLAQESVLRENNGKTTP